MKKIQIIIDKSKTVKENAILNNCSIDVIYNRLKAGGIKLKNTITSRIIIDFTKTQLENSIINNCSPALIQLYCKKHNIKLPEGRGKIPNVVKNPFDLSTKIGSYWFGYFLGDGTHQGGRVGICSIDLDHIKKFHSYCNNTNKIYSQQYYTKEKEKKNIYYSLFGNKIIYNYLVDNGISFENKTLFSNPKYIDWNIFRGLFDADGTFSNKEVKITTSNLFIKQLVVDFLNTQGYLIRVNKKKNSFDITIKRQFYQYGDLKYKQLLKSLYYKNCICLDRKLVKFKKAALIGDY